MVMTGTRLGRHRAVAATVALIVPATLIAGASPALATHINEVTNWNRIAVETLSAFPGPAGGAPPASQVHMGMTQGAVYDAINAIVGTHRPYLLQTHFDASASKEAAAATAAYRVLSSIASDVPATIPFGNKAALQARWDTEYALTLGHVPDSQAKTDGIAAGNAAADAMIAARQGDGRFGPSQWNPNPAAGHWQPLLNASGAPILDPTPWVGGVKPFLMTSSTQFRTDGPQSLASRAWAEDFNEVKSLGRIDSTTRTPEQTHVAIFWQSTPVATWNAVARDIVDNPAYGVDVAASARLFAMLNLTAADAAINGWNDKYYWDFWRPWNAIPRAAEDGNPATEPDASWRALITAPYPDHPSGHLSLDGAYLNILQSWFGDKVPFVVTSVQFPGETRAFDRFSDALAQIIDARIWAGLHYRTADIQAQILGRKVAHYMSKHYFQPLD
jgi:hypothetical protein